MTDQANEERAIRALLTALWEALQPYHFILGLYVGVLLISAVLIIDRVLS